MRSIERLLLHLHAIGVEVTVEGQRLILEGPPGAVTEDDLAEITRQKPAIIDLLTPPVCGCPNPNLWRRRAPAGEHVGFVCFTCMWRSDPPASPRVCSCREPELFIDRTRRGLYCRDCWGWREASD